MKEPACWLYQQLTLRRRRVLIEKLRSQRKLPVAIIFYHRVADTHANPWTLSCGDFARQLDWLQDNYDVVSLAEAQRRIQAEFCDKPTVAITFDDGYAENVEYAIPELLRRDLTAAYFVTTKFARTGEPFPHDVAAGVPLAPNSIDELRWIHDQGIEIGAHTRCHADLGALTGDRLHDEIDGSIAEIEQWLQSTVRYFAAPYGMPKNLSQAAIDRFKERGLAGFCSAYGAFNWPGNDGFHLRRIHADPGLERLKNWLTLDARKLVDNVSLPFIEPVMQVPTLLLS